jgi:hypothetical protein
MHHPTASSAISCGCTICSSTTTRRVSSRAWLHSGIERRWYRVGFATRRCQRCISSIPIAWRVVPSSTGGRIASAIGCIIDTWCCTTCTALRSSEPMTVIVVYLYHVENVICTLLCIPAISLSTITTRCCCCCCCCCPCSSSVSSSGSYNSVCRRNSATRCACSCCLRVTITNAEKLNNTTITP